MSDAAAPGWYPDPERPETLRYWDGWRWTEHRLAAPPPGAAGGRARGTWVAHHRVLTAAAVVVLLLGLANVLGGPGSDPRNDEAPVRPAGVSGSAQESAGSRSAPAGRQRGPRDSTRGGRRDKKWPVPDPGSRTFLVTRVVDGDTLELGNGETVRLVGIDTPEVGECGFDRARRNLEDLTLGRRVRLGRSDEDRDGYGRVLRYVDVGPTDAGLQLIRNGDAVARYDSRDGYGFHPRERQYVRADRSTADGACSEPAPAPRPLVGAACAPGYRPCVPPFPPDVDCADVDGPVRVSGSDPHGLDADGDGWACE